ncbi:hypothetical protein BH11BAC3_BH11BAC3_00200 [soil metagenome]
MTRVGYCMGKLFIIVKQALKAIYAIPELLIINFA